MLLTREELDRLAVIDPTISDYCKSINNYFNTLRTYVDFSSVLKVAKNPRPATDWADHNAVRLTMDQANHEFNVEGVVNPVPVGREHYHQIPMRDGFISTLKIHQPIDSPPGPLIVLAFGGGFIAGDLEQMTRYARALVRLFGATVVSISYRVGPEYKFPTAQYDAWDSMKWMAENATGDLLRADPTKGFIIGGVSAGGAIAASLSRAFQEQPLAYPLTGQWLCIASMIDPDSTPEGFKEYHIASQQNMGPFLSRAGRDAFKRLQGWDSSSPLRFAYHSKTPLSGQPRTYFQVDGMDPIRDDSLIYDHLLTEAGVPTKIDIYPGAPHGHMMAFVGLEITDRCNIDTMVGFGWLLGKEVTREEAAKEMGL